MRVDLAKVDLAKFDRAADEIERLGFWDGSSTEDRPNGGGKICFGLALAAARADHAEFAYAARQLGWFEGDGSTPAGFIYVKNDEFEGRPEEGKEWAISTLRKLARGESLV